MAKQTVNIGTTANDRTGDNLRTAFNKINENFTELYTALGLDEAPLNLGAFEFTGSTITTTDSSAVVIDQAVTVSSDLTVGGDVLPNAAQGGDLGSLERPWKSLYVSDNTIFIGSTAVAIDDSGNLTVDGAAVNAVGSADWSAVTNKPIFASVATSGSYTDLSNKPTIPANINDLGDVALADPVNGDLLTYFNGEWINAALLNYITAGSNVSLLNNDAGYITAADIAGGTLTIDVNNTGDLQGSVFGDDSAMLVDATNSKIVGDVENITINTQNIRSSNTSTGNLLLQGSSTDAGNGGTITIWGGSGFGSGNGGFVAIEAGSASGSGTKGGINIGTSSTATGSVTIGLPLQSSIIVSNDDDSITINGTVDLSNATVTGQGFTYSELGGTSEIGVTADVFDFGDGKTIDMQNSTVLFTGSTVSGILSLNTDYITIGVGGSINMQGSDIGAAGSISAVSVSTLDLTTNTVRSEGDINISVNLTDSTTRNWAFTEGGDLTLPNGYAVNSGEAGVLSVGSDRLGVRLNSTDQSTLMVAKQSFNRTFDETFDAGYTLSILNTPNRVRVTFDVNNGLYFRGLMERWTLLYEDIRNALTSDFEYDYSNIRLSLEPDTYDIVTNVVDVVFVSDNVYDIEIDQDPIAVLADAGAEPGEIGQIALRYDYNNTVGFDVGRNRYGMAVDHEDIDIRAGRDVDLYAVDDFRARAGSAFNLSLLRNDDQAPDEGININLESNGGIRPEDVNTWTFQFDGKLRLPENGDIVDSTGNSVFDNITGLNNNNDINITINNVDSTTYTWNFGNTGDLTIPGNIESNGSIQLVSNASTVQMRGTNAFGSITYDDSDGDILIATTGTITMMGAAGSAVNIGGGTSGNITLGNGSNQTTINGNLTFNGARTISPVTTSGLLGSEITIQGGTSTEDGAAGGDVFIDGGLGVGAGDDGVVRIDQNAAGGVWIGKADGTGDDIQTYSRLRIHRGVTEDYEAKTNATGVVEHDCDGGHLFYHTSPTANWTVNLTNLNAYPSMSTNIVIVIEQGGTPYYPSALQIGGSAQTIKWLGNVTPTPQGNKTEIATFTIFFNGSAYNVLGSYSSYG